MNTLLTLLVAAAALVSAHPDYSDTWDEYKLTYNKQYSSEEEEVSHQTLTPDPPSSGLQPCFCQLFGLGTSRRRQTQF